MACCLHLHLQLLMSLPDIWVQLILLLIFHLNEYLPVGDIGCANLSGYSCSLWNCGGVGVWLVLCLFVFGLFVFISSFSASSSSSSKWSTGSTVTGQGNVFSNNEPSVHLSRGFWVAEYSETSTVLFPEGFPQSSTITTALSTWPNTEKVSSSSSLDTY